MFRHRLSPITSTALITILIMLVLPPGVARAGAGSVKLLDKAIPIPRQTIKKKHSGAYPGNILQPNANTYPDAGSSGDFRFATFEALNTICNSSGCPNLYWLIEQTPVSGMCSPDTFGPTCYRLYGSGTAYTSDYAVATVLFLNVLPEYGLSTVHNGETFQVAVTDPGGAPGWSCKLTYNSSSNCFYGSDPPPGGSCNNYCIPSNSQGLFWMVAVFPGCSDETFGGPCQCPAKTGQWAFTLLEDGLPFLDSYLTVNMERSSSSPIAIAAPPASVPNANGTPVPYLVQLNTPNALGTPDVSTSPISFAANTNQGAGPAINWSLPISYLAGYGPPNYSPVFGGPTPQAAPGFNSTSGNPTSYSFESMGGQVLVQAQASMPGGSYGTGPVTDCVAFYVEGPEAPPGIPDSAITTFLTNTYQSDPYFPVCDSITGALCCPPSNAPCGSFPACGSSYSPCGTPNLMTGIAMKESSYHQFLPPYNSATPPVKQNDDLWGLHGSLGLNPYWPYENMIETLQAPMGSHIGLMMVPTEFDDAWDWQSNAEYGEEIFAGMLRTAGTYWNAYKNGYTDTDSGIYYLPLAPLTAFTPQEKENMALALYRGLAKAGSLKKRFLSQQYYVPTCASGQSQFLAGSSGSTNTCAAGKWFWKQRVSPTKVTTKKPKAPENMADYVKKVRAYAQ